MNNVESEKKHEQLTIDDILPYGEMIRPLLASSLLSRTDLKDLLFKKGIVTGSLEKSETIPLLTTTLLTPSEFNMLRMKQVTKENTPKIISRELSWDSDKNLFDAMKDNPLFIERVIGNKVTNFRVLRGGTFVPKDKDKNNLELEYIIERQDPTKDFFNSTSRYEGRINLQLDAKEKKLSIIMESTANETQRINDSVYTESIKEFERKSCIIKDMERKVLFGDFSNEERIKFLLSLQGKDNFKIFDFEEVTSIEVSFDEKVNLPEEIDWMDKKVKNMILKGEQLHDTEILKNPKYHQCLIVANVVAKYKFSSRDSKGECTVEYGFFSRRRIPKENTEFEFRITKLTLDKDHTIKSEFKVKRFLSSLFNKFKNSKYQIVMKDH